MSSGVISPSSMIRRNVVVLACSQALSVSTQTMTLVTSPLVGHLLSGSDKSLSTLPIFIVFGSMMTGTIPASLLMKQIGRRAGFSLGAVLSIIGGLVCAYSVYNQNFWLLCLGSVAQGLFMSFAQYYRFAAADNADQHFKPKAISLVLTGGVVAGIIGAQSAKWSVDWFAPVTFMGVYVMIAIFALLNLSIMQLLSIPKPTMEQRRSRGRPVGAIFRNPKVPFAIGSAMIGYGAMTLLMTATPLAMLACGFQYNESATVIQIHTVLMFLPSFYTGSLIRRFGAMRVIIIGAIILLACVGVKISGTSFTQFTVGLALLGLGWNFTFIGATSLLTETYRPEERAKVQGINDFLVFGSTTLAAGLAGLINAQLGWKFVDYSVLPFILALLVMGLYFLVQEASQNETTPTNSP